jgi:hypothetical protein
MCWKKRKTKDVPVCSVSGLSPNPYCINVIPKQFYVEPKSGEPDWRKLTVCTFHEAPAPPPEPTVTLDVCPISFLLPNGPYCPKPYLSKTFPQSQIPTTVCQLHVAPPIPPPLPAKAKYPLYAFIPELLVAQGDINAFARRMRAAGVWGVRFFLLQSWSTVRLVPWEQATYNGQLITLYSKKDGVNHCPVTDMTRPNAAYWTRLADVLAILKANDLEAVCSLGDNCSMNTRNQKLSYPFLVSLQTMSPDPKETLSYLVPQAAKAICTASPGGLYGPSKYPLYRSWVAQAIAVLNASGCAYRVEIQNEFNRLLPQPPNAPENWYAMMVNAVTGAGVPAARIVHSGDQSIVLSHGGTFSMHGIAQAGLHDTTCAPARMMLSSDGAYAGKFKGRSTTDFDSAGHHGPSVEDAIDIAKMIRSKGIMGGYEAMIMNAWRMNDCLANVDNIIPDVFQAMTEEWKK